MNGKAPPGPTGHGISIDCNAWSRKSPGLVTSREEVTPNEVRGIPTETTLTLSKGSILKPENFAGPLSLTHVAVVQAREDGLVGKEEKEAAASVVSSMAK